MSITEISKMVKAKSALLMTLVCVSTFVAVLLRRKRLKRSKGARHHNTNDKSTRTPLIVITGCDTGLGYSIVMRYLNHDCCDEYQHVDCTLNWPMFGRNQPTVPSKFAIVAFCLNPQGSGAQNLLQSSLANDRIKLFIKPLDLTDGESIKDGVTFVNNLLEHDTNETNAYELHALVNNAARMIMAEFEWQTSHMVQLQFDVNIFGPMMLTSQLLPKLRKDKSRIINVISHCAYLPLPGISIYGATKSAILAWSVGTRVELKSHGVQVITFLPGSFYLHSSIMSGHQRITDYDQMRNSMNDKQLTYYGAYIDAYQNYLSTIDPHINSPEKTIPSTHAIYRQMDKALWDVCPKAEYSVPDPWRYKIYYSVAWILSTFGLQNIRDKVVHQFVATPQFENHVVSQVENV